jgi:divinyl protochlorophyllide a 8-vinyl-reductase
MKSSPKPSPASRVLLSTIKKHSWTFAGTRDFSIANGHPVIVSIKGCPLRSRHYGAHPQCDYYAGTFQRLFEVLVSRNTSDREISCEATGGPSCAFEIAWKNEAAAAARAYPRREKQS